MGIRSGEVTEPVEVTGTVTTTGPLTDAELRATPVPVDVTDRAARDLGKVDVASLDQYTPVVGRLPVDPSGVTSPVSVAATLQVDVTDEALRDCGKVDVASLDQYTPSSGRLPVEDVGNVAHDGMDSGNPVKVGGFAAGSLRAAVAASDRVDAYFDREGRLIIRPYGAGTWTQVNFPAANTRATSTRAAAAAGIRHVCTGITIVLAGGTTAPAAIQLDVRLRDGIADTGTILWQTVITLPATAGAMNGITRSGLWIVGTAATAMTLEFSAAGGANTFESVSFEGLDITEA